MADSDDQNNVKDSLARIRKMVLGNESDVSPAGQGHGESSRDTSTPITPPNQPTVVNPSGMDEGTAQNLAGRGATDRGTRTPLTDYASQHMPHLLDESPKPPKSAGDSPTADNGFNEPHHRASVQPLAESEKPAPFVTGVSDYQIKKSDSDSDEIPKAVIDTLLQSDDKGKVHIRSGQNAPAFTSPHSLHLSINRENRDILDGKPPESNLTNPAVENQNMGVGETPSTPQPSPKPQRRTGDSPIVQLGNDEIVPAPTSETAPAPQKPEPLVLTDVVMLTDIVTDDELDALDTADPVAEQPTPQTKTVPQSATDSKPESDVDQQVLDRIRQAMEQLKQTQISQAPFDSAMTQLVHDEIRPHVKQWLNDNLPHVVDTHVDRQIQIIMDRVKSQILS